MFFKQLYPTGEINNQQFQKLYKELYPNARCNEAYLSKVFAAFDDNLSGTISFTEFLIAISLSGSYFGNQVT
jgi:Ca2+-binding EF-hand superfamily protein